MTDQQAPEIYKGLAGVPVDYTAISKVNPETNSLLYRGYPVQDLAARRSFEEVAYLLWHGELPSDDQLAELDLSRLIETAPSEPATAQLSTYPAATQDLTLLVPLGVPAEAVRAAVVAGAGDLLEHARIVDDYRGQGVPEGLRALTFALRFRADDRTLKAEEASEAKLAGVKAAETAFGAKLRD